MRHKGHEAQIEKYGSEEAWKQHMREIGSKGGKAKVPTKGFGSASKEQLKAWQSKGGSKPKNNKALRFWEE